jgi:hypothetical protein
MRLQINEGERFPFPSSRTSHRPGYLSADLRLFPLVFHLADFTWQNGRDYRQ